MRSLAEATDDDAPQGVSLAQPQGDGRAPIRRHDADADAAPIPPAPPPAVDFDALMAAMRADDVDHGWPDEPGDVVAGAAADDDAAGPASARADHPSVEDAVICPSATGARSESRPAAKAPIVTGFDIDLMDEDEADLLIRKTIRAMIQEELHGELGERFSRNLRAVIRREIASAIENQMDRL